MRGTLFGVLIMRILLFQALYKSPLYNLGNHHISVAPKYILGGAWQSLGSMAQGKHPSRRLHPQRKEQSSISEPTAAKACKLVNPKSLNP